MSPPHPAVSPKLAGRTVDLSSYNSLMSAFDTQLWHHNGLIQKKCCGTDSGNFMLRGCTAIHVLSEFLGKEDAVVIFWTLQALKNAGMEEVWQRLCEYTKLWCWPLQVSQKAGVVAKLVQDSAVKQNVKEQQLRCSASKVLSLQQPLRHFLLRCCTVPCDLPRRAPVACTS